MNFRVGQKVVCVDASSTSTRGKDFELQKGRIYTVRWTGTYEEMVCIRLEEITKRSREAANPVRDMPFRATRFRPLVEKKTDAGMAILKSILDDVNAGKQREIVDA